MKLVVGAILLGACASDPASTETPELPRGTPLVRDVCVDDKNDSWPYFASTADSLFWISWCDASIRKASKLDGSVQVIVRNEPYATMLAVDEEFVYWTRNVVSDEGELVRASQLDGIPVVIAPAQDHMWSILPQQLVVDDANIYRSRLPEILSIPKDGSAPPQVFARGDGGPFLAVDSDYVYWANMHTLHRQRKGTNANEQLATTRSVLFDPIALTETALYYSSDGTLYRIDKITGAAVPVVEAYPLHRAFISDGVANVYWQRGSTLVRMSDEGVVTPIVEIEGRAKALAVDSELIFWIETWIIYSARL